MKKSIILMLFILVPNIFHAMGVPPLRLTKSDQLPQSAPRSKELARTRSCNFNAATVDNDIFKTATTTLSARRNSVQRVAGTSSGSPRNEIRPRTSSLSVHCEPAFNN